MIIIVISININIIITTLYHGLIVFVFQ